MDTALIEAAPLEVAFSEATIKEAASTAGGSIATALNAIVPGSRTGISDLRTAGEEIGSPAGPAPFPRARTGACMGTSGAGGTHSEELLELELDELLEELLLELELGELDELEELLELGFEALLELDELLEELLLELELGELDELEELLELGLDALLELEELLEELLLELAELESGI